jgi:hypothetical protein
MSSSRNLLDLYEAKIGCRYIGPTATDWERKRRKRDRQNIGRLNRRGIQTVEDLIAALPDLSVKTIEWAADTLWFLKVKRAAPVLWKLMERPVLRRTCAIAIGLLDVKPFKRKFVALGDRELARSEPNIEELHTVLFGLRYAESAEAAEVLVSIFERTEFPGWLRGDVADTLGGTHLAHDRRTKFFQRAVKAAIAGLDDDIHMQFWSMYLLASLACRDGDRPLGRANDLFHPALPRLRQIARNDSRLSPGLWWPMLAEAEDAIGCIETGRWPQPDAADRWSHNTTRGEWNRP